MQTARTDNAENTDPMPLRNSPHRVSTIMIRFVGLLILATAIMAFAWSR